MRPCVCTQSHRSRVISLENLKTRTGVTDEHLDQECDDEQLKELSQHIVDYRKYGPRLGLADADIRTFERDPTMYFSIKLITAAVFMEWHERKGVKATYRVLVGIALKLEDGTGAEKICQMSVKG